MTEQRGETRAVVARIRAIRKEQGMTAQKLSDRCLELGTAVPRTAIAKLETGRREAITIDELTALARALQVPVGSILMTRCAHCYDNPPAGFTCNTCGAGN